MNITKEQFEAYVDVQMSGVTNMWAVDYVCDLAGQVFTAEECLYIMKHYSELKEKYGVTV